MKQTGPSKERLLKEIQAHYALTITWRMSPMNGTRITYEYKKRNLASCSHDILDNTIGYSSLCRGASCTVSHFWIWGRIKHEDREEWMCLGHNFPSAFKSIHHFSMIKKMVIRNQGSHNLVNDETYDF